MKTSRVSLDDAVEYVATQTKTARKVGIQNGAPTDFEQAWLNSAAVANCVEALAKRTDAQFSSCDTLKKLAKRGRVKAPALGIAVLQAYLQWCRAKPGEAVDRTKQCEPACKCGLHGLTLGSDRGIVEAYAVLRKWIPTLTKDWNKVAKTTATQAVADAYVLLAEWVDKWNAEQGAEETHLTVKEFAQQYGVPESTVQRWCEKKKLPAKKVSRLTGGSKYLISKTELERMQEESKTFLEQTEEAALLQDFGISVVSEDLYNTSFR